MKTCTKCKNQKPLVMFNKHKNMKDGRHCHCKECVNEYGRANKENAKRRQKRYMLKYPNKSHQNGHDYMVNNREKLSAHGILNYHVKVGNIIKPKTCSWCEGEKSIEGHHEDYNNPKVVKWLCRQCHRTLHFSTCQKGIKMRESIKIPKDTKSA